MLVIDCFWCNADQYCVAFDERDPRRSDDVDDEGLGQQRFDKHPVWNSDGLFQAPKT